MTDWIGCIYEQDLNKLFTLSISPNQEYRLITKTAGYIYPLTLTGLFNLSIHLFTLLIKDYFNPTNPKQLQSSLEYITIHDYIRV